MAYSVALPYPTHDIILRDAAGNEVGMIAVDARLNHAPTSIVRTPVERSSLKMSSGNQSYSDLEPPYTVLAQNEWQGGRGSEVFEDDVTRYRSSCRMETGRQGKIFLSGRETYATGFRLANSSLPGSMQMMTLVKRVAVKFTAAGNYTTAKIGLWVTGVSGSVTVNLRANNAGDPGTVLQSSSLSAGGLQTIGLSELFMFPITPQSPTSGTEYWVEIVPGAGAEWKVGVRGTAGTTKESADGVTWDAAGYDLYYRVREQGTQIGGLFFNYKRMLYFVTQPTDATASTLWRNGVRGVAKSNAGQMNKLLVNGTSPGYTVNEHAGCVLLIMGGKGMDEEQNWRVVTANGADNFTVDSNWLIEHDTTTEFVVLGSNQWTQITLAEMTKTVTDVMVASEMVVFASGDARGMYAMREYNNAGTWTRATQTDTNKAVFLEIFAAGGTIKWARSTTDTKVSSASEPGWGVPVGWNTAVAVGYAWERITGLTRYANDAGSEAVWVMKESGPWEYDGSSVASKARDEMRSVMSRQLGKVAAKSDVYLWLSVMNTVWRYYSPTFDDVGFMLDEGMPVEMRGNAVAILPYPGRTLVAIDAGASGYSCVLENNGGASWHEKYRAPFGERIFAMELQVVPGNSLDRLWIRQGADVVWIPFPSNAFDPKQDSDFLYQHEGSIELGAMYAGLQDAWKYWSALKMHLEDLEDDTTWVEADYRLEDGEWTPMPNAFTQMPLEEQTFGETDGEGRTFGVSSKKFQLRVRLISTDVTKSPVVRALIIEAVTVNQPKFTYSLVAQVGKRDVNGKPDETREPYETVQLLDEWSGTAQSLWMRCVNPLFDGRAVFLAPVPNRPLTVSEQNEEFTYTTTITLQEA